MFGVNWQEILLIVLIVLLLFGAKRIPEVMRSIGKEFGIGTPASDSLVRIACALTGVDFWASGRKLAALGWNARDGEERKNSRAVVSNVSSSISGGS